MACCMQGPQQHLTVMSVVLRRDMWVCMIWQSALQMLCHAATARVLLRQHQVHLCSRHTSHARLLGVLREARFMIQSFVSFQVSLLIHLAVSCITLRVHMPATSCSVAPCVAKLSSDDSACCSSVADMWRGSSSGDEWCHSHG